MADEQDNVCRWPAPLKLVDVWWYLPADLAARDKAEAMRKGRQRAA